jgi:hypothetical protein
MVEAKILLVSRAGREGEDHAGLIEGVRSFFRNLLNRARLSGESPRVMALVMGKSPGSNQNRSGHLVRR